MTVPMDENTTAPPARELAPRLFKKNIELENGLRKSAQSKVPSDPNAWLQMRENYEAIILDDHDFSEKHEVEYLLWQLHYRRIEEFRSHINATASTGLQAGKNPARPDRIMKIRTFFKSFLSESTGFYHDLILKIRAKYGLPLGYFGEGLEIQIVLTKDEKKSVEMKKGLLSCHRCLIYLGDLSRYKGLYGEGDSIGRDYAAASSYYTQATSLWPSSGNPHHQLAILASYCGDDLVAIYRYFRSLAVDSPFTTARDNLIIAFEKNRQSYSQLPGNIAKVPSARALPARATGKGRGRGDSRLLAKATKTEFTPNKERDLSIPEIFKAFSTRFIRLNGILFTRTSLETFGEIFSSVISDLNDLLSSGPEEELNFGQDAAENGLVIVRLITILIFTVHNANRESEDQSYAEILQRSALLQNAFTAAFEIAGHILKRCIQLLDAASCFFLPGILVFIEWLACRLDIAAGFDAEEKQAAARSFFWNQFVSFMNKLMLMGLVSVDSNEDESCFSDLSHYDDEETGNRLALWEDFELRGFSPLVPAQLILDFSRKYSFASDASNKEKKARVQRILAAGRVLMSAVRVEQKGIYFDSKLKKFVIAAEPPEYDDHMPASFSDGPEINVVKQESQVESIANLGTTESKFAVHSKSQLYVGGEDEEEEIVFKPTVSEKYSNPSSSMSNAYNTIQPVQSYSNGEWAAFGGTFSAALNNVQISTSMNANYTSAPVIFKQPQQVSPSSSNWLTAQEAFIYQGLKNLNIVENGLFARQGLQENLGTLQSAVDTPAFSVPPKTNNRNMVANDAKVGEAVIPSKLDSVMPSGLNSDDVVLNLSAASPTISRKNPVSRPVRHVGPPPGFNHVPAKQADDLFFSSVVKQHHHQIDDYSWLDDYEPPASKGIGSEKSSNHIANSQSHMIPDVGNTFSDAMRFPFPGKQISTLQARVANEQQKDFQPFDQCNPYSKQQLQPAMQPARQSEQYQAQSLWSGRYYV